jgi:hypothetical protein
MKTFRRISSMAVFVMIGILGLCAAAQAYISGDHEYIVSFRPGVTWEQAQAEVAGWGEEYHLVTITSRAEYKHVKSLLQGLRGEFLIGGHRDGSNHWNWVTEEPWEYSRWAKGKKANDRGLWSNRRYIMEPPWEHSGRAKRRQANDRGPWSNRRYIGAGNIGGNPRYVPGSISEWDYLAMSNMNSENAWRWYSEGNPRRINGFIAERTLTDASPVPVPSAALLLGSGLSVLGGLRMARRKAEAPKESSRPMICN